MAFNPESLISADRIVDIRSTRKDDILNELVDLLATSPNVKNREELRDKIFERERQLSTGVGAGMAIPHVKLASIKDFVAAVGRCREGVDFQSLDHQPTSIIVMIGCNNAQSADFLKLLALLVKRLKDPETQKQILEAPTPEAVRTLFVGKKGLLA